MGSTPKPPPPINVAATTQQDMATKLLGAQESQALSTISQDNPYGSLDYTSEVDPITGLPKYKATQTYTPQQQAIFDLMQGNQTGVGQTSQNAISSMFGQYGQDPNLVGQAGSLTDKALDAQMPAWERFNAPARAQKDTEMRTQGILPGTPAYQQQMDALTQQQQRDQGQWLSNFQPQAFNEAQQQYELPLMNVAQMMGLSQPGNINQNLTSTPGANVGSTDVAGLTTSAQEQAFKNYQMKVAQQNAMMSGIMGGVGGAMKLPTGGGSSVGGDMMSMLML